MSLSFQFQFFVYFIIWGAPAQPFLVNWEVPFVTCGEFLIPCTRGFAARAGIIPSLQIRMMGLAQSLTNPNNYFDNP